MIGIVRLLVVLKSACNILISFQGRDGRLSLETFYETGIVPTAIIYHYFYNITKGSEP